MARYAEQTSVSSDSSRAEIERTLRRYSAQSFLYGWDADRAVVGFVLRERQMRFILPMPDPTSRDFTHTPARGYRRSDDERDKAYEQAVRQRWRALNLVIKAKLEAVAAGIVTFESEFGMHMVLPSGRTVAEEIVPAIDDAYETGVFKPLLAIGGA